VCRHVAWLGRPRTVSSVVLEPPHGLLRQSWAPRRQRHGTINADGWGVGWWEPSDPDPARWRSAAPLWSDASLASVARHVTVSAVLAAVRSASAGMPADAGAAAPFARGPWLVSHNGVVDRAALPAGSWQRAESTCDAAILAVGVLDVLEAGGGGPGLGALVAELGGRVPEARLNLLAGDGRSIIATAWGDSLWVLAAADGTAVASEPWDDDPGWREVPDRTLLTAGPDGVALTPLEP